MLMALANLDGSMTGTLYMDTKGDRWATPIHFDSQYGNLVAATHSMPSRTKPLRKPSSKPTTLMYDVSVFAVHTAHFLPPLTGFRQDRRHRSGRGADADQSQRAAGHRESHCLAR